MQNLNKAIIPLLMAFIVLGVVVFILPFGVEARQNEPNLAEVTVNPQLLAGSDIQLSSGTNSNLPEIAVNGSSVAVVYVQNNQVFLRWAQTKWAPAKLLDATRGGVPKVAFLPSTTSTVHIVWTGYNAAGTPQKAIRHIRCTMSEPGITCGSVTNIATTPFNTTTLQLPDLVIDSDGHLHVAWFENPDSGTHKIKTARSNLPDNGIGWSTFAEIPLAGGDDAGQPALATAGNFVHLAFRDRVGVGEPSWQVDYRRTSKGSSPHNWGQAPNAGAFGEVSQHNQMSNPTIAAGGSNVYLAWDTQLGADLGKYALVGVLNTNSGGSTSWGSMKEVTSDKTVSLGTPPDDDRLSHDGATPSTEDTLRPSVALWDTNDFVMVWQQRPDTSCPSIGIGAGSHQNGTSEIYYAESQGDGWTSLVDTLADEEKEYSIDPDIAIDSLGQRHVVFMKASGIDSGPTCANGGDQSGYGIYYRGPVTEKWPENPIYLPVVVRNG